MPIQRAIAAFKTERLNCAQSVLRAFQPQLGLSEQTIQQARGLGGGQAQGGRCGALHAALELAGEEAARDRIQEAFVARAGSQTCRDIRKAKALSCMQCVELAAALLREHRPGREKGPQVCP